MNNKFYGWLDMPRPMLPIKPLSTLHIRLMIWYLRRRGWLVAMMGPTARQCGDGFCWMEEQKKAHHDGK